MKRTFIILSITSLLILGLLAVNQVSLLAKATTPTQEILTTASQLYQAGQFAQAALAYQQLVDQGYADSALDYNLGNAYYKQGDLGRAILNFRRAAELAPRDADIAANLELARLQAVDKVEQTAERALGAKLAERITQKRQNAFTFLRWRCFILA
jgi:Flp pilus assembly protein TadD